MARRLFERQGVRRRAGSLASGVEFVVYADEAGTVLADISATVGGSSIPGATITTGDIAGLGPDALRFYGPSDATDTLFLRAPGDASLGVQKIEAATDPRLDALEAGGGGVSLAGTNTWTGVNTFDNDVLFSSGVPWVDATAFVEAGDGGDDALAVQRAIDFAQTLVAANTGAPNVYLPAGEYHWLTSITWKSAGLVADAAPNVGVRVFWDGASGATVITKDSGTFAGGISWGRMEGIQFISGDHEPSCWLDLDAGSADFGFRLKEVAFIGGVQCAIRMASFYNCHWEHVRFDGCGSGTDGFAIRITTANTDNLGSFTLDGFTYDNRRDDLGGSGAEGMILVDSTANPANIGVLSLKNGRIEADAGWSGRKGLIVLKVPNSGANARSLGLSVVDVTYQDVGPTSGDVLLYLDTTATNLFPSLILQNFRQDGLTGIVGGSLSTSYPPIPVRAIYGFLMVSQGGDGELISASIALLSTSFGGEKVIALFRGAETVERLVVNDTGKLMWSSGSAATDANLYRQGPATVVSDNKIGGGQGLVMPGTAATTPGSVVSRFPVYEFTTGTLIGYVPIYNTIT